MDTESEATLYCGTNELGFRQYYLDEAHTQPVCPVTLKQYTNAGEGVVSEEGATE